MVQAVNTPSTSLTHLEALPQLNDHAGVNLAADDFLGLLQQQLRHDTSARTDLQHDVSGPDGGFGHDGLHDRHVLQEVLATASCRTSRVGTAEHPGAARLSLLLRHGCRLVLLLGELGAIDTASGFRGCTNSAGCNSTEKVTNESA